MNPRIFSAKRNIAWNREFIIAIGEFKLVSKSAKISVKRFQRGKKMVRIPELLKKESLGGVANILITA